MKITLFVSSAFLVFMTAACSPPASAPSSGPVKIEPDGVTPNLTRSTGTALYNLEQINSVVEPLSHQPVSVPSSEQLIIIGWAVDQSARGDASSIEIAVDGKAYRTKSGLNRQDVADHFKEPEYLKSGFNFSAPAEAFGKGRHQLTVRIISKDGKSYFESPPVTVNVE